MKIQFYVIAVGWTSQDGSNEDILKEIYYSEADVRRRVDELWKKEGVDFVTYQLLEIPL